MRLRKLFAAALVLAAILCTGRDAEAAQCSISTTPLFFGNYDVFVPTPLDSVATVVYECNGGAKVIAITISQGLGATFTPRKLFKSATEWLGYNLYRDPSRTVIWGNGTSGTSQYTSTDIPNNRDVSLSVYGRIPAGQDVRAGIYGDYLSVTVNF